MPRHKPITFDLTSQVFGCWTALHSIPGSRPFAWMCRCECGTERAVGSVQLRQGLSASCGCLNTDKIRERSTTHGNTIGQSIGQKKSREYRIWLSMKARCKYPYANGYKYYGGKGVKVCDRWANSFEAFRADMGPIPTPLSIDRIDSNGDYCLENCRLATPSEQRRNQRRCTQNK